MSLDNIQLPPITITRLFRKSLVGLKSSQPSSAPKGTGDVFAILGKNQKGVLVIINDAGNAFLKDGELDFLLGILSACKLNMDDAGILNLNKYKDADYKKISAGLTAEVLLLFGPAPEDIKLPLSFPAYQIQKYNSQTYLCAPPLATLQHDKAEKAKLWNCLKQIFSI